MEIINNNPFRVLGVYSNASAKDVAGHLSKANALANVKKTAEFEEDMLNVLPHFNRDLTTLGDAQTKINLPADKLKYALFWFCNVSPVDDIALGHLRNGNVDKALELFSKQTSYSSLINKGYFFYRNT